MEEEEEMEELEEVCVCVCEELHAYSLVLSIAPRLVAVYSLGLPPCL